MELPSSPSYRAHACLKHTTHYLQWKQNQLIRQAESKVQVAIAATLVQLTRPRTALEPPVNNDVDVSVPAANFVGTLAAPHQTEFVETNRIKRQLNVKGAFRFECFDLWILPHWCVGDLKLQLNIDIQSFVASFWGFVIVCSPNSTGNGIIFQ
jgi:hypothetical protein